MYTHTHTHTHAHTEYGVLLSHKKEWNNVICSMDGPRDYHIKWSKSDRERQILYITYLWNLKKWCKWTYKTNRLTDIENNLWLPKGTGGER